jgi:tetratricopeptide (TPR) repeat protein
MFKASVLLLPLFVSTCLSANAQQAGPATTLKDQTVRAEEALRAQDVPTALAEYRAMIAANPQNSQAWTALGVLLYGSGHAAEAAESLAKALKIDPQAPHAELFLSFSQADLQQCDAALPVLQKYFAIQSPGKLQRLTGLTLLQCSATSKDPAAAVNAATRLRELYPGDPDVLYELAELYTRMWNQTANELIAAHPESYRVHQLAAEVNEAQGNFAQAIRQYKAALGQNAKLPQMHYRIGQLLLRIGSTDADEKAMEEFQAELAINPQSATSALAMGEIERHQGKLPEATREYTQALKLEPGLPEARVGLAQTLLAQHNIEGSESQLRTVIAEHPDNAQAHYAMMLAYRAQGKLPEATTEMATFKQLQQGNADQFQKKLNALLTGASDTAPTTSTVSPDR